MKDTDPTEIRGNHLRLSRIIHPDKCSHPKAAEASAIVNQAADTLRNPLKKKLYDNYVSDVNVDASEGQSYAEWEAKQVPVEIPKWVESLLKIPGGKFILFIILILFLLVVFLPLVILLAVIGLVLWILCLPFNILIRCCGLQPPPPGEPNTSPDGATPAPTQPPTQQQGPQNV